MQLLILDSSFCCLCLFEFWVCVYWSLDSLGRSWIFALGFLHQPRSLAPHFLFILPSWHRHFDIDFLLGLPLVLLLFRGFCLLGLFLPRLACTLEVILFLCFCLIFLGIGPSPGCTDTIFQISLVTILLPVPSAVYGLEASTTYGCGRRHRLRITQPELGG